MNKYICFSYFLLVGHVINAADFYNILVAKPTIAKSIQQQTKKQGYAIFKDSASCPFTESSLESLRLMLKKHAVLNPYSKQPYAHRHAYQLSLKSSFTKEKSSLYNAEALGYYPEELDPHVMVKILSAEGKVLEQILGQVEGNINVELVYYDELKQAMIDTEESVNSHNANLGFTYQHDLYWHQDKFGNGTHDFLFFIVLNSVGISEHNLQIGKADASSRFGITSNKSAFSLDHDDPVQLCESIPSQKGAGYFIDQSKRDGKFIVHKRTDYFCLTSNRPLDAQYKKIQGINSTVQEYVRPEREVLIMRIKIVQ